MIKIPDATKKFSLTNLSDTTGNIHYTKNINFDEYGYIKLSSRTVSLYSEKELSDFGNPYSLGRVNTNSTFNIVTNNSSFAVSILPTGITFASENLVFNSPGGSTSIRGKWWQGSWYATTGTALRYKGALGTTWADAGIGALNSAYQHPLEVFKTRNTICIGDGNTVKQFTTAYASSTADLSLPSEYMVTGLAFSYTNKMGVATQLAPTLTGQNTETQFYTWDGLAASPNSAIPTGTDAILAVVAYQGTWVILTRQGKLRKCLGSSFEDMATIPYFNKKLDFNAILAQGDILSVEGDLIYINLPGKLTYYGKKQEQFLSTFPGGILCYDPKVGLYHRYSPSLSKAYSIQTGSANINTATGIITATSGTIPATGNPIMYTSDPTNVIGGLSVGTVYYIIKLTSTTFQLATTNANALTSTFIALTSTGAASSTFLGLDLADYGISFSAASYGTSLMGKTDYMYDHLIFGGTQNDYASSSSYRNLSMTIPQFPNRGYYVTSKIESQSIQDNYDKIFIKYRPLKATEKIIVKYKNENIVGLPVSTPQRGKTCTWTSNTVLTTTADLSEAYTYFNAKTSNQLECEIISGAGAGQMAQISAFAYAAGTYTITLKEALDGATNGYFCDILLDNWKRAGEITSSNPDGYAELPIKEPSKWVKVKVELRGVDVTIEELQVINSTDIKSQ